MRPITLVRLLICAVALGALAGEGRSFPAANIHCYESVLTNLIQPPFPGHRALVE